MRQFLGKHKLSELTPYKTDSLNSLITIKENEILSL